MRRIIVWIPDELAEQARAAGLNVSALTQTALRNELARDATGAWLTTLPAPRGIDRDAAAAALEEAACCRRRQLRRWRARSLKAGWRAGCAGPARRAAHFPGTAC